MSEKIIKIKNSIIDSLRDYGHGLILAPEKLWHSALIFFTTLFIGAVAFSGFTFWELALQIDNTIPIPNVTIEDLNEKVSNQVILYLDKKELAYGLARYSVPVHNIFKISGRE